MVYHTRVICTRSLLRRMSLYVQDESGRSIVREEQLKDYLVMLARLSLFKRRNWFRDKAEDFDRVGIRRGQAPTVITDVGRVAMRRLLN